MNRLFLVFLVVLGLSTIVYISMFISTRKTPQHTRTYDKTELVPKSPIQEKERRQKPYQQELGMHRDSTAKEGARNKKASTGIASSSVSRGKVTSTVSAKKYLIYVCGKEHSCAGWADRQAGLTSVYLLSVATGRTFGIIMDNPCNVTRFYVPNEVNWIIPADELKNKTSTFIHDKNYRGKVYRLLRTRNFNEYYPQDVVYILTNDPYYHTALANNTYYATKLPRWARSKFKVSGFAKAWQIMMRPSQFLQRQLDDYLKRISYEQRAHPLVCSHVRIGKSETLKDSRSRMNVSDVTELWKFLDKYVQNGSKLFLATDNLQVRTLARQRYGTNMSDTGGNIVHVDRWTGSVDKACEGFGHAVLDQLILTKCDVLILTGSGFGIRASYIRGTNRGLYSFGRKGVQKKTVV